MLLSFIRQSLKKRSCLRGLNTTAPAPDIYIFQPHQKYQNAENAENLTLYMDRYIIHKYLCRSILPPLCFFLRLPGLTQSASRRSASCGAPVCVAPSPAPGFPQAVPASLSLPCSSACSWPFSRRPSAVALP